MKQELSELEKELSTLKERLAKSQVDHTNNKLAKQEELHETLNDQSRGENNKFEPRKLEQLEQHRENYNLLQQQHFQEIANHRDA